MKFGDYMKGVGVTALFGSDIGNAYMVNKFTGQGGLREVFSEDLPRSMMFGGKPAQWAAFDAFMGEGNGRFAYYNNPYLQMSALYYGALPWGLRRGGCF